MTSRTPISTTSASTGSDPSGIPSYDFVGAAENPNDLDPKELAALRKKALGKSLVDWVRGEYAKCKTSHVKIRNQWYMNLAFYNGDQYVERVNNQILRSRAPQRRIRLVINRVRPMIQAKISQMTSQKPTAQVVPASSEIDDLLAAEAGEAIFENAQSEQKLEERYTQAAFWEAVCGTGYIKTYWDKNGDKGEGYFCYAAPTPFNILVPDLLVEDIEDQPYVLHIYTKPIEWVKQRYADQLPKDFKPGVIGTTEIMETQYLNVKQSDLRSEPDSCLFIECWIKPGIHKDLPDGGLITVCDEILIQACLDGIPYDHGQFPFTKFGGIPTGTYYNESPITDYIQLQMEFNRNRSLRVESRNMTANPAFLTPKGVVDVSKVKAQPGQWIEYNPGLGKPEPLRPPDLPSYVIQEDEAILRDMEDVSGQHQVSRGQNPTGVTAGTAISFLQEADNSFMATIYLSIERGFEKIGKQTLQLFVQYVDIPKLVKITGGDTFSVMTLTGSDIKSGTDLRIESGSSLPVSRAARNAMFMDLMKAGAFSPQQALKLMNIPNMKEYYDRTEVDSRQAQRENQKMMQLPPQFIDFANQYAQMELQQQLASQGLDMQTATLSPEGGQLVAQYQNTPIIPVNDWDNHQAHIEEHSYFMKSQRFESLPDQVKGEFKKHLQAHKDKMMQEQLSQMMQMGGGQDMAGAVKQGLSGGQGPEKGAPNPGGNNQFTGLPPADGQSSPIDQGGQPPAQ